ncbi:1373_t:CDS:2 [Paraglomus occultum]|uniref:1373_t:CDS:1 n=1 Tax=Paraglomus occultum TaxID=144539 RepID=A0A9N8WR96_9GLOM|nr:1373_t:CDS:2 [Paraglomus occultum]
MGTGHAVPIPAWLNKQFPNIKIADFTAIARALSILSDRMHYSNLIIPAIYILLSLAFSSAAQTVVSAKPFITAANSKFGGGIEGTAVDQAGNVFAVDFGKKIEAIGQLSLTQKLFFAEANNKTFFNAVRFVPVPNGKNIKSAALAGDVLGHRVLKLVVRVNKKTKKTKVSSSVFCENKQFLQPNDLAIAAKSGFVYLSGQNFTTDTKIGDGDLWLCTANGKTTRLGQFGRTNGIEVSPDERTLYLSEAFNVNGTVVSNKILKFDIDRATGHVRNKQIFADFKKIDGTQAIDIDGMRTDKDGNLFVTRNGGGQVVKFSPTGKVLLKIKLSNKSVSNLEFGGKDGKTLFMVGACDADATKGCVDTFRNNPVEGRAFALLNKQL